MIVDWIKTFAAFIRGFDEFVSSFGLVVLPVFT